jgi:hypothetical protein
MSCGGSKTRLLPVTVRTHNIHCLHNPLNAGLPSFPEGQKKCAPYCRGILLQEKALKPEKPFLFPAVIPPLELGQGWKFR